jgi:hypothetical protein
MLDTQIVRNTRSRSLGIAGALALVLMGVTGAEAQQIQTFPGSLCQVSGSTQDLYYSGAAIANRGNSTSSAVCPIVRGNSLEGWLEIVVSVRDRHSTLNVTCVAQARNAMGIAGSGWSQTRSTVGEGDQTLFFGAPGVGLPDVGPYVVVCSLPPMEEVNQPSYIASYSITEP